MQDVDRLALKLPRRDKEALRTLAQTEGEAMAVIVRRLIRQAAERQGLLPPAEQREGAHQ